MFNKIIDLYSKGDISTLSSCLLHSSSWLQHQYTAYGHAQIEALLLENIQQFGFLTVTKTISVDDQPWSALYLELGHQNSEQTLSLSFIFEHNQQHIKRMICTVDTVKLAAFTDVSLKKLLNKLVDSDPLILSQFDHQLHPQSYHASPEDLHSLPDEMADTITHWWQIWQQTHLTHYQAIYSPDCTVTIAGNVNTVNVEALRAFHIALKTNVTRSYCQLQNLSIDENQGTIAVLWQVDGDYKKGKNCHRIRIPVTSILTIKDGVITDEVIQIDWLAVCKQFNLPLSFI